jgi:hypothetical protein
MAEQSHELIVEEILPSGANCAEYERPIQFIISSAENGSGYE